jgi:hypothetical protein
LDEERARAWVTELIVAWEVRESSTVDPGAWDQQAPTIDLSWEPRDPGQEDSVYLLVGAAQQDGVLAAPTTGATVEFEYVDDGQDGSFRWLLTFDAPRPLQLVTEPQPIAGLGESGWGVEAALGVLRQAAHAANLLMEQLSDYIAATAPPT